jgi:hypothetical protein
METLFFRTVEERRELFIATGARMGIRAELAEKDFWVCWILRRLFTLPELGEHLTFKGGTSLSKAYGLIDRFSEDIDLILERAWLGVPNEPTGSELQWLKKIKKACRYKVRDDLIPMLAKELDARLKGELWELVSPQSGDEDPRMVVFRYPTAFPERVGDYVLSEVKMEFNSRSDAEPANEAEVRPYAAIEFPDVLPEAGTRLRCLAPERTFLEKATLLHEELLRPIQLGVRSRLSRHIYDLAQMLAHGFEGRILDNLDLYQAVVRHRAVFFANDWMGDYSGMLTGMLILRPADDRLAEWRRDYKETGIMFFSEPPPFGDLLDAVDSFARNLNKARGLTG